jgi:hypothetical protein
MNTIVNNINTIMGNKYMSGALLIALAVCASQTATPSKHLSNVLNRGYIKIPMYFLIAYIATHDIMISFILAIILQSFSYSSKSINEPFCDMYKNPMMVYQGTPLPLSCQANPVNLAPFNYGTGNTVVPSDVYPNNQQQACTTESNEFMYSFNQSSPDCCKPGLDMGLSTSTGCLCVNDNQRMYVRNRGGNAT